MAEHRDGALYGLLAEYETPGALIEAAKQVRDAGYTKWDCHSPFPVHGIDEAMGVKRTILPWLVFCGGLTGAAGGLALQWWTNAYDWPWLVSGKPFFSIPANIPVTFESTVLLSAFTAFLGMWALNKLPRFWNPWFRSERFLKVTDDRFFIAIEAADPKFDAAASAALLEKAGAVAVERCHLEADRSRARVPQGVLNFIVVTTLMALIPIAVIAHARASTTELPRRHVMFDMDQQFKQRTQAVSDQFDDHRGMRLPVAGTVAFGHLDADDHFYRGVVKVEQAAAPPAEPAAEPAAPPAGPRYRWADTFPVADPAHGMPGIELDERTMARGRERFGIFCAPCHGLTGRGDGMISKRATKVPNHWTPPADLQAERIVRLPHGQLFFTITKGVRNMPGYGAQLPPEDRWAIILYLRALQRSQRALPSDVPADQRDALQGTTP